MAGIRLYLFWALLFGGLLLLRVSLMLSAPSPSVLLYTDTKVSVAGVVVGDPERRSSTLHANIAVQTVDGNNANGTVLAILPRPTELEFGDTVSVTGKLELPEAFETDTGRVFDYQGYLKAKGVVAIVQYATLDEVTPGGVSLQKSLFALKHFFERSLERLLPEPDVSLMEGILLGERRGIPEDLNSAFIASGLVHMVVLSGYNMSVVADNMLRFFGLFLPKTFALSFGGVGVLLFAILAGAGATTVRACIMGLIAILGRYLQRPAAAMRALLVAGAAMVLWNPLIVLHDPSFILSVLATFGLITLSPWVETHLRFLPQRAGVRANAASTIAVQIFVLPALLYLTGVLSIVALPANIAALPVVPYTMLGGFFAGLAGLVHPLLALPFTIVTDMFLKFIMLVATMATALPFSSVIIPPFPLWLAIILYIPLTWFAIAKHRVQGTI